MSLKTETTCSINFNLKLILKKKVVDLLLISEGYCVANAKA